MKTLLTTLLSFIVLSASATVYNSDGTVQNIQAIHNNQAVVVSERIEDLIPFLFQYPPSAVPDFGLVVDRNRRPDRAREIRHGTRRN
jgi:hypothetical protein